MKIKAHLKKASKATYKSTAKTTVKILQTKIGGKQLFINKYTKKVPVYKKVAYKVESIALTGHTAHVRMHEYKRWFQKNYPSAKLLKEQLKQQRTFKHKPLISILVPTYNTDPEYLQECIESVLAQSYENWELCIADDSSTDKRVRSVVKQYSATDKRIKYTFRKINGHICEATNSALELASGAYIALLDHDDIIWPNALFEVVKVINVHKDAKFLRSINYITHFSIIDRKLVNKVGGFRKGYEGAQDWDLFLRVSRETDKIFHIPKVLYSWRMSENSTAKKPSSKDYAYINQKKALRDDINSRNLQAGLDWQIPFSMWRVSYKLKEKSLVSIIIPTKNQFEIIKQCLESIRDKTTYKNYEVVIVDTGSTEDQVWSLYDDAKKYLNKVRIVKYEGVFNFSSACDLGAKSADGEYLLFLNNDTEVITPTWIEDMLGYAQQKDIGAVGCKLFYPDRKIQHAGIILGVGGQSGTPGIAGHFFPAYVDAPPQDPAQLLYAGGTRNFTAVTAACVMVAKDKFKKVKGFDPKFQIAFNDVDLCLKLLNNGWRNVYLPHVNLYHHESISVGQPGSKQRDLTVFAKEIDTMLTKWGKLIENDPYFHPEFRRDIANARLK